MGTWVGVQPPGSRALVTGSPALDASTAGVPHLDPIRLAGPGHESDYGRKCRSGAKLGGADAQLTVTVAPGATLLSLGARHLPPPDLRGSIRTGEIWRLNQGRVLTDADGVHRVFDNKNCVRRGLDHARRRGRPHPPRCRARIEGWRSRWSEGILRKRMAGESVVLLHVCSAVARRSGTLDVEPGRLRWTPWKRYEPAAKGIDVDRSDMERAVLFSRRGLPASCRLQGRRDGEREGVC